MKSPIQCEYYQTRMSQTIQSYHQKLKAISRQKLLSYIDDMQINRRLICLKCEYILIEPYQTPCGCRLCLSCMGDLTLNCNSVCPICNDRWSDNDICKYDMAVEREINDLQMNCINEGCTHKCKLSQLMDHLEECAYRAEKCQQCGEYYPSIDQERHMSQDCRMMMVKCSDCNLELTKQDLEEVHRNGKGGIANLCSNWKGVCPYGCCEDVQENIKTHVIDCKRFPVNCIMKEFGCPQLILRPVLNDHLMTGATYHMGLLVNELTLLRKENEDFQSQFTESYIAKSIQIEGLQRTIHDLSEQIDTLTKKVKEYESGFSLKHKNVPDLCYSMVATEGECLWKVDDILDKIKRAKVGGDVRLYSVPFYSTSPRYRLCLKMYPNGDGIGFGTHVSIFFVIMKGEYDDEVPWPFCRKISISLVTNKKGKQNRVMNMKPDRNESCYGKPKGECNVAAGSPRFISHDELSRSDEFVENGSITILAVVD